MADLSRLRTIVKNQSTVDRRLPTDACRLSELTYEPDLATSPALADAWELAEALGGRCVETTAGPCLAIDRRYDADRYHGSMRIRECAELDLASVRVLTGTTYRDIDDPLTRYRWLFVDLETTGLSGGAGTLAFLVGCGYFEGDAFCVRQFFLPAFRAERALLAAVASLVESSAAVVTYNGKTFDLPVLETRWLFHRLSWPFEAKAHLDLLHPARRLWRAREGARAEVADRGDASCSLAALERVLLGVTRFNDVPGFDIPARYFRFLRSGDPQVLEGVLEHNRMDLLSLAGLTALACRIVAAGAEATRDAWECVALGRLYERAGQGDRADLCYERVARAATAEAELGARAEALKRLAVRRRRGGRHADAAEAWHQILGLLPDEAPVTREAAEALAVHHEHRARDLASAHGYALRALRGARSLRHRDAAAHRLRRLDLKMKNEN